MAKRKSARPSTAMLIPEAAPLKFDQNLVLLQWMLWLFDKQSVEQLAEPLKSVRANEIIDGQLFDVVAGVLSVSA
jgi:hypothetical protein